MIHSTREAIYYKTGKLENILEAKETFKDQQPSTIGEGHRMSNNNKLKRTTAEETHMQHAREHSSRKTIREHKEDKHMMQK